MKTIFVYQPHQGKERSYVEALKTAGYSAVSLREMRPIHYRKLDFALFNNTIGVNGIGHHPALERIRRTSGAPVFMFPHAARPMVQWDLYKQWPQICADFVIAEGHREVMQRIDYPFPVEIAGWTYCEIKPFEPVQEVRNILFGPIHPNGNGWIAETDKDINRLVFIRLLRYMWETGCNLTVRHIGSIETNGLMKVEGVEYVNGNKDLTIEEIDQADLVVSHQTFAYLAVARGRATLMMAENVPPRSGNNEKAYRYVKNWEKYADLLMFPLDILDGETGEMIDAARKRNAKVTAWRKKFIGEPFEPDQFVEKLERYL